MIKINSFDNYINQLKSQEKETFIKKINEKFSYEEYIKLANKKLKTIETFINKNLNSIDLNMHVKKTKIDYINFFSYIELNNNKKDIDFCIDLNKELDFERFSISKINTNLKRTDNSIYGIVIKNDNKIDFKISKFNFFGKLFFDDENIYKITSFIEKEITYNIEKENFDLIIKLKKDIEYFISFMDIKNSNYININKITNNNELVDFKDIKSQCDIFSLKYDLMSIKESKNTQKLLI